MGATTASDLHQLVRENSLAIAALRESQARTDRQLRRQLSRLEALFTGRWGKLVESLVEGNLVELLRARGIQVEAIFTRAKRLLKGKEIEIDILARNGTEIVAVEVKTTLAPEDVRRFAAKLRSLRKAFPDFADKTLYGAVAYLRVDGDADRAANRRGLFVIRATGNSALITNDDAFRPTAW